MSHPSDASRRERDFAAALAAFGFEQPEQLLPTVQWIDARRGDILFKEGDAGDSLFVILRGRVRFLAKHGSDEEHVLSTLGAGDFFGELALLTGEPRSATAQMLRDTELACIGRAAFESALARHPHLMLRLAQLVARRLRNQERRLTSTARTTLACVVTQPTPRLTAAREALVRTLAAHVPLTTLGPRDLPDSLRAPRPPHDAAQRAKGIAAWLNAAESDAPLLWLDIDPADPEWASQCFRQADRVLYLVPAVGTPTLGVAAQLADALDDDHLRPREELVLIHPPDISLPSGTRSWLALRPFASHYHLRNGHERDLARLGRLLRGTPIGLVLSGGGAKAFAEIGVLRALEEAAVPVDLLGGSSMGAIMAAQYAQGWSPDRMQEVNRREWHPSINRAVTLPIVSLFSTHKISRVLERMFGAADMEDLWVPAFCTATNLSTCQLDIGRRGPVARWVQASAAPPALWPPVVGEGGDLLVDGGVLDNVPIPAMRASGARFVIAVNVAPHEELRVAPGTESPKDGLTQLRRWLTRRDAVLPNLVTLIYRTAGVTGQLKRQRIRELADLYIEPETGRRNMFKYQLIDQFVEAGHRAARAALDSTDLDGLRKL